jgi:hypothetical protein
MLTAHRQEPQPGTASQPSGTQAGGFAKVLNSIQGLQQRLDGFSLEEASQAEANVATIIQQLFAVQAKLNRLTEVKQFVASTNWMIGAIPEQNFEQVDLDSLKDHPQLHAIIQASKLIRVHKLMQAARSGVDALVFHDEVGTLPTPGPETSSFAACSLPPPQASTASLKQAELQVIPPTVEQSPANNPPEGDWVFSADAELEQTEPPFIEHTVSLINDREDNLTNQTISKRSKPTEDETSPVVRETGFDERLLSDLIHAYGEFSPVSKSSPGTSQAKAGKLESRDHVIPSSAMHRARAQEISSDPELMPRISSKPALFAQEEQAANSQSVILATEQAQNPKTVIAESPSTGVTLIHTALPMLSQPQVNPAKPESGKTELPKIKKHGELDRQLKNIIKDYGEYDLYPHENSTNLKKAALAVFAVLAFVLAVFYFLKAPSTPKKPAASSVTQSLDSSKTRE